MSERFFSQRITAAAPLSDLGIVQLENPFCTDSYVKAIKQLGYESWVIGIKVDGLVSNAAIAAVRRGKISATLEIASLPGAAQKTIFWDGVYELMKRLKITDLIAQTFNSPSLELSPLRGEISRTKRVEYILQIGNQDFFCSLSSNHTKNVKKARIADVTVRYNSQHSESLANHVKMMEHSRDRRMARGEQISASDTKEHWAHLESGAGQLFQALHKGRVVSSLLVLRSAHTAYFHSLGTSPQGMRIGASHFLIYDVCRQLFQQGVRTFNLGGAPEGSSLARFKAGFGATPITLCECACYVGPVWRKMLRSALHRAQTGRAGLRKRLSGSPHRILVYGLPTNVPMPSIPTKVGACIERVSDDGLMAMAVDADEPQ